MFTTTSGVDKLFCYNMSQASQASRLEVISVFPSSVLVFLVKTAVYYCTNKGLLGLFSKQGLILNIYIGLYMES